jgi:2',3'-cyclic-nucleotide 2'-phosphodiesterase (5'-nucleotidase family)
MNAMKYDAMTLGERELGAPLSTVQARFEEARFPILSANVETDDELPNMQSYLLRQVGEHTIAIVGVTSEEVRQRFEALDLDLTVEDPITALGQVVDEARQHADIIILLSTVNRSSAEALAQAIPGIDVIIGVYKGGQRAPVAVPGAEGEVVFQASGMQGKYLSVLTLHFDAQGQVTEFEGRSLALTDHYADDPEMVQLIRRYASEP